MFGPVEPKKRKHKASGRGASSQQKPKGSKAGIRSWFGKGLEIKGSGSGASSRQKALHTSPAASTVSRSIQNATDLASDCSLNLRESAQQFEVQSVKPLAAAVRADSPVHGIDALLPALPWQGREGAALRIQRWYRHRQAERRAAQQDVRDFVQQRRQAAGVHIAENNEGSDSYADREALAAAAVAKAARLATEKQEAEKAVLASLQQHCGSKLQAEPTLRDLREGLKQASKAAEKHHTEQPGPDQHQLQSDVSQQDYLPSITLSVSPRQSQQSNQGIVAAVNSKLIGLPWLRATSPPQLVSQSAAADRITAGASQLPLQRASALGQQDYDMPVAGADPSMAEAKTCDLDQRGRPLHADEVTASIAAAVRESLLLSVPADAVLSSALFDDFTREVAARIIQHYWREHVSRQAAGGHQYSSTACHDQDQGIVAESRHQGHATSCNPGNAEAVPSELIQDDSLPELLMRYRSSAGSASEQQQAQTRAAEDSQGARTSKGQNAPMALHTFKMDVAKAGDVNRDGLLPITADDTRGSSSSLDRLKARHSKHRRPAQLTANTAVSVAQHAMVQQAPGARQSNSVRLTVARGAATADVSLHQAHFAMPDKRIASTAGSNALVQQAQPSTTSPACEDSDSALFELLNQAPQGPAYVSVSAAAAQPASESGRHQQQQQQQTVGMDNVRGSSPEFQEASDENASPNVSPADGQAKQHKQQQHQQEAAWDRASDPASMTVLEGGSHRDTSSASATAAALHVGADDPASASGPQPVPDVQAVTKSHGNLFRSERLSTDKLADINAFLDDVEAQAEEEAARVLSQASTPSHSQPIRVQGHHTQPCCQAHVLQPSPASLRNSCSRTSSLTQLRQQQTQQSHVQYQDLRAHVSRHGPSSGGLPAGKPVLDSMLGAATTATRASPSRKVQQMLGTRAELADTGSARDIADTVSTGSAEPPGADKASLLAKTVYEGVKQRMHQLQADVQARDHQIASLQAGLEAAALHKEAALKQAQAEQQCALDEQKKKLEGDMARHLAFIDRLLADKDKLSAKCMQLGKDMKAAEAKHAAGVESLKEGWVVELKKQKEAWTAAEKARRDTWLADKTKQVKELTVKGMEPEIQRLIAKHKAELQSERVKAQDHTRLQLDDLTGQHETYARQLRDRLLREQDLAVERERAAAQDRLREAAERYEGQMQSQRLRMVSDSELRLEQFQAERKDEKRRYEDALNRLKQGQGEQEQQLCSELSLEKAQMRRQHERELQALRDKMADEQEGWRLAIAKRAKEELASREAALRTQLIQERDHQLQVVVERLETEAVDNREATTKEAEKRETALKGRYQAALQAAQDSAHKHAERFRVAGLAEAAAQQRNEQLQNQVAQLQQHLQDQRCGLADAKQQASSSCSLSNICI
ncbi:TPA: hypothetical protein ACH3X1_006232 [Trebouxia sp. C0004]